MHLLGGRVQAYACVLDEHLGPPGAAPEQGAQAGLELVEVERLDQIVVGAGIQPGDAVAGGVAGGEHQHWNGGAAGAQALQHAQAVQARQAEVEQQQVEGFLAQGVQGAGAVLQPVDGVALLAQAGAHAFAEGDVVFHEQQAHQGFRGSSPLNRRISGNCLRRARSTRAGSRLLMRTKSFSGQPR
ncbi:hypothetical protein D3C76_837900 [compost metagenome]